MDRPPDQQVREQPRTIGVIGRPDISPEERDHLVHLGRLIHRLGRRLATIPAEGVADAVREGFLAEGGEALDLKTDVIGQASHTFVVPDRRLLLRLHQKYPDLKTRSNVTIAPDIAELVSAVGTVAREKGVPTE